ncbi:cardiolipin synthase [Thalassobacillus cyri]|uniref:Cardiolipin synthase n=1 Tax=Thalassobacillus cyri TaxID=571932 RepID=A0A1H4DEX8_9BACI|nr:cardiolipin synthase [Thalassobacillus cyri]SEA70812.1 cardiolipin synthase [Thalassobacillus cyri]
MTILLWIIAVLIIIILLILLDFVSGRQNHKKNLRKLTFTETSGSYRLFQSGNRLFEALFTDIKNAETHIDILFFIVKQDETSQRFYKLLQQKAQEGVVVRLMVDRLGGFRINKSLREQLENSGIQFQFAAKPQFPFFIYKLNRRNHRKIVVIDGKIGYVGGYNVADEYVGKDAEMGDWRDYHLRMTGEVVTQLHAVFLDDWFLNTKEKLFPAKAHERGAHVLKVLPTEYGELEEVLVKKFSTAKQEILLGSPYFIPSRKMMDALLQAIQRGVTIKLLCPLKSDHPFVKEGGIPFYEELYRAGGEVRLYDAGFYHAKVFIIDKEFCDLGTSNLDLRSLFLNKEINIFFYDKEFIHDMRKRFLQDFAEGIPFDDNWLASRSIGTKINIKIARLIRPIL